MKATLKLIAIVLFAGLLNAQNILNDPSIVAQHKRMVYESWGDFRPNPKYVLGVQTNLAYATVWGWLSPNINQDYKNGEDIRPLKPTGLEVQRLAELELQKREAEEIKLQVDSLYNRNVQDFAHWTSVTVDADPLWLLYYKKMLEPLRQFSEKPQTYYEWALDSQETYDNLLANGGIEKLQEQLDVLKDQYHNSRTMPMPRGKRFLLYHSTLIGWRDFSNTIRSYQKRSSLFLDLKKKITRFKNNPTGPSKYYNDEAIVHQIMTKYHKKY